MNKDQVINELYKLANPEKAAFKKAKYNIVTTNALGIYLKDLNALARKIGKDKNLAIELFNSGLYDAQILCSKIIRPTEITKDLMEQWIVTFNNWEICDSFSMGLFSKSPYAKVKIIDWATREQEFEKRAAFATLASYTMANKKADNETFEDFYPLIINASVDERLYVKKAVSWALRSIGKRNADLQKSAIETAVEISKINNKAAQ